MPVVAVFAVALVALLILLASAYLVEWTSNLVPNWHIPGLGNIRSTYKSLANGALAAVLNLMDDAVHALAVCITTPMGWVINWLTNIIEFCEATANAVKWLVTTEIPATSRAIQAWVNGLITATKAYAVAYVLQTSRSIQSWATGITAAALTDAKAYTLDTSRAIQSWVNGLVAQAVATAEAFTLAQSRAIQAWVTGLIGGVQNDAAAASAAAAAAASAASKALSAATGATNAAVTDVAALAAKVPSIVEGLVDVPVAAAIDAVWGDLTDAVDGAIDVAGDLDTDITDALKDVTKAVPTDLVGVLAGVTSISIAATRFMRDCGIPNCKNLSGLGNFLEDLLDGASLAAMLAMLLEIVHDPEQAAQDAVNDLSGLLGDAQGLVSDLLSV